MLVSSNCQATADEGFPAVDLLVRRIEVETKESDEDGDTAGKNVGWMRL